MKKSLCVLCLFLAGCSVSKPQQKPIYFYEPVEPFIELESEEENYFLKEKIETPKPSYELKKEPVLPPGMRIIDPKLKIIIDAQRSEIALHLNQNYFSHSSYNFRVGVLPRPLPKTSEL